MIEVYECDCCGGSDKTSITIGGMQEYRCSKCYRIGFKRVLRCECGAKMIRGFFPACSCGAVEYTCSECDNKEIDWERICGFEPCLCNHSRFRRTCA